MLRLPEQLVTEQAGGRSFCLAVAQAVFNLWAQAVFYSMERFLRAGAGMGHLQYIKAVYP